MDRDFIARELLKVGKSVVAGGDIEVGKWLANAYRRIGKEAYESVKRVKGVTKQSALDESNRNNNTFAFEWSYEGYTRSDFEAKAEVTIVMYLDGTIYVWVYGERPDWGSGREKILDEKPKGVIPVRKIEAALESVFG